MSSSPPPPPPPDQRDISENMTADFPNSLSDISGNNILTHLIQNITSNMQSHFINPILNPIVGQTNDTIDTEWGHFNNLIAGEILRSIPFNHGGHPLSSAPTSSLGNHIINLGGLLQRSFLDPSQNAYKHVVSEEGKKQMKLEKYDTEIHKETFCPITQNNFEEGHDVIVLPCKHIFEPQAIQRWLQEENATCPVCRFTLQSKEVRKQPKGQDISSNAASSSNAVASNTASPITFFSSGQSRLINNLDFINSPLRSITRRRPVSSTFQRNFVNHIIRQEIDREEEADLQKAILASLVEMQKSEEEKSDDLPSLEEVDIQVNIDTDIEMENLCDNDISEDMDDID